MHGQSRGEKRDTVVCAYERKEGQTLSDTAIWKLTSSVSFPSHGCGSAGPPGEAWCPAARRSSSGTFSSAAAQSAANPHYLFANQRPAACVQTQILFYLSIKSSEIVWPLCEFSRLSIKMSFALLLCLQLVVKLLLKFLFGKVHFPNGSVVFYPPLACWRTDVCNKQISENVSVTFVCLPLLMQA